MKEFWVKSCVSLHPREAIMPPPPPPPPPGPPPPPTFNQANTTPPKLNKKQETDRGALLNQIHKGAKLRPAKDKMVDKSGPVLGGGLYIE